MPVFVDGEKWPPSLHGTGSEDYLNQAYGMQENAYLFNGSSLHEGRSTVGRPLWDGSGTWSGGGARGGVWTTGRGVPGGG